MLDGKGCWLDSSDTFDAVDEEALSIVNSEMAVDGAQRVYKWRDHHAFDRGNSEQIKRHVDPRPTYDWLWSFIL